jgi:16S rRNA (uracil1498-N3)-methyltransferase
MARTYRFFLRNLSRETLLARQEAPLRLTEKVEPDIFYQLVKVLRVSPGDRIILMAEESQKAPISADSRYDEDAANLGKATTDQDATTCEAPNNTHETTTCETPKNYKGATTSEAATTGDGATTCDAPTNTHGTTPCEAPKNSKTTAGDEFVYEVASAQKKEVILRFKERVKNENELDFRLELLLCMPNKPDKLEMILQKAVEIGAAAVTIVKGDFSRMKHNLRPERLRKIMTEAAEQSERAYVPELGVKRCLRAYLTDLNKEKRSRLLVAMERSQEKKSLPELLVEINKNRSAVPFFTSKSPEVPAAAKSPKLSMSATSAGSAQKSANAQNYQSIIILIGPEGGFSPQEKAIIAQLNLPCFSLGRRILRVETAAIVSIGIVATFGLKPSLQ